MGKDHFVDEFYCKKCGSTTAIKIGNSKYSRCIGCLILYEKGDKWVESENSTIYPLAPKAPSPKTNTGG